MIPRIISGILDRLQQKHRMVSYRRGFATIGGNITPYNIHTAVLVPVYMIYRIELGRFSFDILARSRRTRKLV